MGIMRDMADTIRFRSVIGTTPEQLDVSECMAALDRIDETAQKVAAGFVARSDALAPGCFGESPYAEGLVRDAYSIALALEEERERLVRGNGESPGEGQ